MHHLKSFLVTLLLDLAVYVIVNAVTAPPPAVSVSVPIVIVHVAR